MPSEWPCPCCGEWALDWSHESESAVECFWCGWTGDEARKYAAEALSHMRYKREYGVPSLSEKAMASADVLVCRCGHADVHHEETICHGRNGKGNCLCKGFMIVRT